MSFGVRLRHAARTVHHQARRGAAAAARAASTVASAADRVHSVARPIYNVAKPLLNASGYDTSGIDKGLYAYDTIKCIAQNVDTIRKHSN